MARILNFLRSVFDAKGLVKIPVEIKKDVSWWRLFSQRFNGISIMMMEEWSCPDGIISTDACLSGCGGWFGGRFFHAVFPDDILENNWHINALELLAIMVGLKLWGKLLFGKRIRVYCDNKASVDVLNAGRSRDAILQDLLREICFLAATYSFEIRAVHLAGNLNRMPDALSRWHLDLKHKIEFSSLTYNVYLQESVVIDQLFYMSHHW